VIEITATARTKVNLLNEFRTGTMGRSQSTKKEAVGRKKKRRKTDESSSLSDGAMADEHHAADNVTEPGNPSATKNDTPSSTGTYLSKAAAASAITTLAVKSTNTKKDSVHELKWN
jgi:hypothetical protein